MCRAVKAGHMTMLALLRSEGASTECDKCTPLMACCSYGDLETASWLVQQGADVAVAALVADVRKVN